MRALHVWLKAVFVQLCSKYTISELKCLEKPFSKYQTQGAGGHFELFIIRGSCEVWNRKLRCLTVSDSEILGTSDRQE